MFSCWQGKEYSSSVCPVKFFFFIFTLNSVCVCMCLYVHVSAADLLELELQLVSCKLPDRYWELNLVLWKSSKTLNHWANSPATPKEFYFFFFSFFPFNLETGSSYYGIHYVAKAGLDLRDPSASWALWLRMCALCPVSNRILFSLNFILILYMSIPHIHLHVRRGHQIPL